MTCRYCGSADLRTTLCAPSSPHHAESRCAACGRHQGWVAAPMTPERAAAFLMPLGAFKGHSLADITSTARGVEYLRWLVAQDWPKPTMRRAVECHLDSLDRPSTPSPPEPRACRRYPQDY